MVPEGEQCYAEGQGSKRDHCVAFRPRLLSRRETETTEDEDVRQQACAQDQPYRLGKW